MADPHLTILTCAPHGNDIDQRVEPKTHVTVCFLPPTGRGNEPLGPFAKRVFSMLQESGTRNFSVPAGGRPSEILPSGPTQDTT